MIFSHVYLVTEWECLLFTKIELLGIVVDDFRLRKTSSLQKCYRRLICMGNSSPTLANS